jgi:hypothetical protein
MGRTITHLQRLVVAGADEPPPVRAARADDVVPFADTKELLANSELPTEAFIEVGNDHRLADPEPLKAILDACEEKATK